MIRQTQIHTYALNAAGMARVCKAFFRDRHRTQLEASQHYRVSENFVSLVANAARAPTSAMLEDMDWKRETLYLPAHPGHARLPTPHAEDGAWSPDWLTATRHANATLSRLEDMGIMVTGYEVKAPFDGKAMQPIISVAYSEAVDALGGSCLDERITQDGTLKQSQWIAQVGGCLVRWGKAEEVQTKEREAA